MPSVLSSLLLLTAAFSSVATALPHNDHHEHRSNKALPSTWYQREDHFAHDLFKRAAATDGVTYPAIGSAEWTSQYPDKIDPNNIPQAWLDALDAAVKAGKIPDIPVATAVKDSNPTYPKGFDPNGKEVCSATYKCRIDGDIWDAPEGVFASSFDDGPIEGSSMTLYQFLKEQNQVTTHFMIGINIRDNWKEFQYAFETLHSDIAVHTYTHPYMTTLSNAQVVAELGYTMDIIHKSTGGRLAKYWRPPFGDSDTRTTAIAREVFGLQTVIWNQDSEDWSITSGGTTRPKVDAQLKDWITGPKNPGLIILEHELSDQTVGAFIQAYPLIAANNWTFTSLARMDGEEVYQNSPDSTDDVSLGTVGVLVASTAPASSSSTSAPAPSGTSTVSRSSSSGTTQPTSLSSSSSGSQPTGQTTANTDQNGAVTRFLSPAALVTCMSLLGAAFALS